MEISSNFKIIFLLFSLVYLYIILKKTIKNKIDLFDFFMLSMIFLIPSIFIYFNKIAILFLNFFEIKTPFLLVMIILFVIIFIFIYKITHQVHELKKINLFLYSSNN
jgi:hypothetical protein